MTGRRTVTITGRGAERYELSTYSRRRPQRALHERPGFRPDRAAMWAVLLGLLLVLIAATSSHAAVRSVARQTAADRRPHPVAQIHRGHATTRHRGDAAARQL